MLDSIRQNAQSWGVKIAFGLIIIVFVFWGVGSMDNQSPNVLAMVNKEPITINDFIRQYEQQAELVRAQFPDVTREDLDKFGLKQQVLQQMVGQILLVQQAKKMGFSISPAELKLRIADIPVFNNEQGEFDGEKYKQILAAQGTTPGAFEDEMRNEMLAQKMRDYVMLPANVTEQEAKAMFDYVAERRSMDYVLFSASDYVDGIEPTNEEVAAAYEKNLEAYKVAPRVALQYVLLTPAALAKNTPVSDDEIAAFYAEHSDAYKQDERVRARHIIILANDKATEEELAAAEKKINDAYVRVVKGEDFAEVARDVSEGPSAPLGGDLGWFGRGQMVPPFEEAAFATKVGTVSKPVRTSFGFHIIKVEEKEEARVKALAEVRDEIAQRIAEDAAVGKITPVLDEVLEAVLAGEDLPAVAKRMNLELRDSGEFTRLQAATAVGVNEDALDVIFATPQGAVIDTPLEVENGYILAKVVSSKDETYRDLETVKADVVARLKQEKALNMAAEDARVAVEALRNNGALPEAAAAKVQKSAAFTRQGFIPGVGQALDVAKAVFSAADDAWIAEAFQTPTGAVIAKRADVIAPSADQWEATKARAMQDILNNKRQELLQAYMQKLYDETKVELRNPDVLK